MRDGEGNVPYVRPDSGLGRPWRPRSSPVEAKSLVGSGPVVSNVGRDRLTERRRAGEAAGQRACSGFWHPVSTFPALAAGSEPSL